MIMPQAFAICRRMALRAVVSALVLVVLLTATAEACPSCKAALANQKGQGDWVSGFFFSILFMVSMPFLCVAGFATYMLVLVRRAKRGNADAPRTADRAPIAGRAAQTDVTAGIAPDEQPAELIEA